MKFKIAKGGAIIMQLPLFADEDDEHPAPEPTPDIDPADREQHQQEIQARDKELEEYGQTPHPDDLSAPAYTVAAAVAHDAMMDAMHDNIDPLMVEVKTDAGPYLRLIQCTVRTIVAGKTMSVYELLKVARQDWQDEKRAEREAALAETQLTDNWTM